MNAHKHKENVPKLSETEISDIVVIRLITIRNETIRNSQTRRNRSHTMNMGNPHNKQKK